MSRRITNNTGYDLYYYSSAVWSQRPQGTGYLVKNGNTATINLEAVFCVPTDSKLISIKTTSGLVLTKSTTYNGTLDVYNEDTGDYDDISVYPFDNYFGPSSADTTLSMNSEESQTTQWTVTKRLQNCTLSPTNDTIADGTSVTFIVTANDGYKFLSSAPTLNGNPMSKTSDTVYQRTTTVTSNITIIATAIKANGEENISYDGLQNATGTPTTYNLGEPVTITITADENYTITSAYCTYLVASGDTEQVNLTISDDKKSATATVTVPDDGISLHSLSVFNTATQAPIAKVLNDLIAIYIPTDEELGEISTKQFITAEGNVYKISEFITSYKKLYVPKELLNIEGKNYVVLGYYNTNVESDVVNDFMVTIELRFTDIKFKHNNTYDYTDNKYRMYLPFIGKVDLDASDVLAGAQIDGIDAQLSVYYKINLITAQVFVTVINLYSDVIYEGTGSCGFDVPYETSNMLWSLYNQNANITGYTSHFQTPTLFVQYHDELNTDATKNVYSTPQWITLSDITGYSQFSDVDLTNITDATFNEKDELETILEKGVFL